MKSNEHSPLFGSWRRAYFAAFALFAFEVILLYAFTVAYS
jgi:hypothetical protein